MCEDDAGSPETAEHERSSCFLFEVLSMEQCGALYEIEERNVHSHLALVMLRQEHGEGSGNGEQCAKMQCGCEIVGCGACAIGRLQRGAPFCAKSSL